MLAYEPASGDLYLLNEKFGNIAGNLILDRLGNDQERRILTRQEAQVLAELITGQGQPVNLQRFVYDPSEFAHNRGIGHIISRLRWIIGVNHFSPHFPPEKLEGRWYFESYSTNVYGVRRDDFGFPALPVRPAPFPVARTRRPRRQP